MVSEISSNVISKMLFDLKKEFQNGACTKFQFGNILPCMFFYFIFDISGTQNSVFLVKIQIPI